ncbi:hypothetical protein PMZ80_010311 [Knufia obscura]|uniref:Uncharacterized protein n=2 Tax=Knufia TaxID=430999 RepID=A0AAN8EHR8_9EURO|nr:hypothetical protein PMZ80_010311 [Knufia obscura]KAK5951818.1 hypothetical protein OHC33_007110 [Knufia fluminis]
MDEEELQLPTLPQVQSEPQLPRPLFSRLNSRKRSARSDELQDDDVLSSSLHTSSDPALFSSDETPDAENYSGGKRRRKKTYAGTWWGEKLAKSRAGSKGLSSNASSGRGKKRQFTRNFDSGIFMNSDDGSSCAEFSSDSSLGNELMEAQMREEEVTPKAMVAPRTPVMGASKLALTFENMSPLTPRAARRSVLRDPKHEHVLSIVRDCLDEGKEDVDLSDMGLDSLPLEVRELSTMIKDDPAAQILFESLVARPRLYLSNNVLRQFPTPVLELGNLRLLSLRRNKLTRLPPGIRNLVKLETLNISGNKLQFLPVEVLGLMVNGRLTELLSEPNPWLTCTDQQKDARLLKSRLPSRPSLHTMVKDPKRSDEDYHLILQRVATSEPRGDITHSNSQRRVPPLSELVLRQLSKLNNSKRDLSALMPDEAPVSITNMLKDLHASQIDGDRRCAGCKRLYVMPARTWMEWWDVNLVKKDRARDDLSEVGPAIGRHVVPFEIGICGGCA